MLSKYGMVCEVADNGSFSAVARQYGYAQSSISQAVRTLEEELGTSLIDRKRRGITWTADGRIFEPYLRAVYAAETALEQKCREMRGMEKATVRIGTFTSVSRDILPELMMEFKRSYPGISFELYQGDYNNIRDWLESGFVDLGFLALELAGELDAQFLYEDEMLAVLPLDHPLSVCSEVALKQLVTEPFILLDEGEFSTPLNAFHQAGMEPDVEYRVYDDYSILSMIRSGLGISLLFRNVLRSYERDFAIRPVDTPIRRRICLACRDRKTLPYAAARFRSYIIDRLSE